MIRYFFLLYYFFKNSLLRELEYRGHFVVTVIQSVGWFLYTFITIKIIFFYTKDLAGFNEVEVFFVYGVFRLITALNSLMVRYNLEEFPELIRTGRLDYYLLKPISARFLVSFRYFSINSLVHLVSGLLLVLYALSKLAIPLSFPNIFIFILLLAAGSTVLYCLFFLVVTMAFWTVKVTSLPLIFEMIRLPARYPIYIFKGMAYVIFMFIIPLGIIVTLPVEFLIRSNTWYIPLISISTACVFFFISETFWRFSISHYTSASS